jgi:hypothetical protein
MSNIVIFIKSTIFFIIFALTSWSIVHVLALIGVFLSIGYLLWWIILPKQSICILCRAKKMGENCPYCGMVISKQNGIMPKSLKSAVLNGLTILLISLISTGAVFLESNLLNKTGIFQTPKTASFTIPPEKQYLLGEIFPMKIEIEGISQPINAVQADFEFNPNEIEVIDISTENSFANIFIQKEINNNTGHAKLVGGIPNPGFSATNERGLFGTIYLRGKTPGLTRIKYLPTSMVLANNGMGDNLLKDYSTASFLILPERISRDAENIQKNIVQNSNVLGTGTNSAQMIFYANDSVLGTSSDDLQIRSREFMPLNIFINGVRNVDSFILSQWEKVF